MALVWAMFVSMVVAGIVLSGTGTFMAMDRMASADFALNGQARNVAEAGLVDAFAWYRRQTVQPVTSFAPKRNLALSPPVNETDDATIGLVREYEIMPSLWARYEVRKGRLGENFTDPNFNGRFDVGEAFTDSNANGRRDPDMETRDVTALRGLPGAGRVWLLVSHGTIFRRLDPSLPLGQGRNVRVAKAVAATEIRRLAITPPARAALVSRTGSRITIGPRGRVTGGTGGGVICKSGTGNVQVLANAIVTGTPRLGTSVSWDDSVTGIFGVSITDLRAMADGSYASADAFPAQIADYTLHVVPGPITFDRDRPLRGTGIVVVQGDCTLTAGNNSFFNGLLYVIGKLNVRGPSYVRGTIIATGDVDLRGTGGDMSELIYDPLIVSSLLTRMGQYRYSTAVYAPAPTKPDGTADEVEQLR